MISTVIVCLNEANKLEKCLESVKGFSDEVVVLDLGSKDETLKVCEKFGVKVYMHERVPFVELVRNFAVSKANGDWVLVLDPDEQVTLTLKAKLNEIVEGDKYEVVNIPRKNIFFGKWISHTNWWPDRHVRFFKKGMVEWIDRIHSYPGVKGKILNLEAKENLAITHFGYESISQLIDRQNRYSNIEAHNLYKEGVRFSWGLLIWKLIREFLVRFIRHAGFMDGFYGFTLTYIMMIYQLMVFIKLWELGSKPK